MANPATNKEPRIQNATIEKRVPYSRTQFKRREDLRRRNRMARFRKEIEPTDKGFGGKPQPQPHQFKQSKVDGSKPSEKVSYTATIIKKVASVWMFLVPLYIAQIFGFFVFVAAKTSSEKWYSPALNLLFDVKKNMYIGWAVGTLTAIISIFLVTFLIGFRRSMKQSTFSELVFMILLCFCLAPIFLFIPWAFIWVLFLILNKVSS